MSIIFNPISKLIQRYKNNDFVRHNLTLFAGSMVVSVVNYLYYPVLSRLLETTEFGEVQALVSLFLQLALLLSVIANVTVNIVANAEDLQARNKIVYEFGSLATLIMTVLVFVSFIFVVPIQHFLKFNDVWPFVILGASLVLSASLTLRSAFLRGVSAYSELSITNFVTAIIKLISSAALVLLGFGTNGAIGGLVVAQILAFFYVKRASEKLGLHPIAGRKWWQLPDMKLIRPELPYSMLVLIVSVVITVLFSIDVVMAKHFFSPEVAGQYAGVATIGRIIFFLTGSVSLVLLSSVKLNASAKLNRQLLVRSIGLTVALGGVCLAAFTLAPNFFIKLLIGARYLPQAGVLPLLSLTLFLISLFNLVALYDVALRRWSITYISGAGLLLTIIIMSVRHASPTQMIQSLLIGIIAMLVLRAAVSLRRKVRS